MAMINVRQRGMSLGELLFFCVLLGGAAMTGLRLFPLYNEKMKVDLAIDKIAQDPEAGNRTKAQIVDTIMRNFEVSDVDRWNGQEFSRLLEIERATAGKGRVLRLQYDIRNSFCCDLDVVLNYHREVELPRGNVE